MKKDKQIIGVISGMGTRAGIYFIDQLIDKLDIVHDQDFPEFILHNNPSIPDRTEAILHNKKSPIKELVRSIELLQTAGAKIIVSTCVTSYYYLQQIKFKYDVELLSPIDCLYKELMTLNDKPKRVGLLATTGTIKTNLFTDIFKKLEIDLIYLDDKEQEELFMKSIYGENGFKSAQIKNSAYNLLNEAINSLGNKEVDLIVGGCSEVQIGMKKIKAEVPFIDTMDMISKYLVERLKPKQDYHDCIN